jgi:poly-gamma-glutamate synthesis protein (capsule biosynthesis protein)
MQGEICQVQGRAIGVIAFSCLLPTGMAASEHRAGLSPIHVHTAYEVDPSYQLEEPGDVSCITVRTWPREEDLDRACAHLAVLKAKCEFVIASIHWGFGSGETLADYQWPIARALIDAGADAIHGHHPHAIHGVGFHQGKPIFFSPNVFVGQQIFLPASDKAKALWAGMSSDGYVGLLTIGDDGRVQVEAVPTTLDEDRLPVIARDEDQNRIVERLQRLSSSLGTRTERQGERVVFTPA